MMSYAQDRGGATSSSAVTGTAPEQPSALPRGHVLTVHKAEQIGDLRSTFTYSVAYMSPIRPWVLCYATTFLLIGVLSLIVSAGAWPDTEWYWWAFGAVNLYFFTHTLTDVIQHHASISSRALADALEVRAQMLANNSLEKRSSTETSPC